MTKTTVDRTATGGSNPSARNILRELVSADLVRALQDVFPDRLPGDLLDSGQLARKVGQQDVVNLLRAVLHEQEKRDPTAQLSPRRVSTW